MFYSEKVFSCQSTMVLLHVDKFTIKTRCSNGFSAYITACCLHGHHHIFYMGFINAYAANDIALEEQKC